MNREEQIKMWEEAAKKVSTKLQKPAQNTYDLNKYGKVNVNSTKEMKDDIRNKHDTPNKSKYPKN